MKKFFANDEDRNCKYNIKELEYGLVLCNSHIPIPADCIGCEKRVKK